MNPILAIAIQEAIKNAPALYLEIVKLFQKNEPTEEDWNKLIAKYYNKKYTDYDPDFKPGA